MKLTAAEYNARNAAKNAAALARYNARVKAYNNSMRLAAKEAQIVAELIAIREKEAKANS